MTKYYINLLYIDENIIDNTIYSMIAYIIMNKLALDINRLKSELGRRGWDQTDLADAMGVSRQAVWIWFKNPNKITLRSIRKIADALDIIDAKELIYDFTQIKKAI